MIINNKIPDKRVRFADLPLGAWYLDDDCLCRKNCSVDKEGEECSYIGSRYNSNEFQDPDDLVLRVDVEINIIPYEG